MWEEKEEKEGRGIEWRAYEDIMGGCMKTKMGCTFTRRRWAWVKGCCEFWNDGRFSSARCYVWQCFETEFETEFENLKFNR